MKKLITRFLLLSLMLPVLFATRVVLASEATGHKVVIDPGHGGTDYGSMACPGYLEKEANLDVADILAEMIRADGVTVYPTRTDDSTLSNNDRYTFANSTDGEALVSIHLNGSSDPLIDGTQGLYGKRNKDKAFTEIMHSAMWNSLKDTPDFIDFGVTNFASGVLLKSNMPATIQEAVFISSAYECDLLKAGVEDGTMGRQKEIAQSLYNGLVDWFAQVDEGGGDDDGGGKPPGKGKP